MVRITIAHGVWRRTGRVISQMMGETAWLAGVGLGIGIVAPLAFTRVLRSMLFEVTTTDSLTYLVIGFVLTLTALIAGYVPARRATRMDPAGSLRGVGDGIVPGVVLSIGVGCRPTLPG